MLSSAEDTRKCETIARVQDTEYIEMTKLLMTAMSSDERDFGLSIRCQSVAVISGRVLHFAFKQISFPGPRK